MPPRAHRTPWTLLIGIATACAFVVVYVVLDRSSRRPIEPISIAVTSLAPPDAAVEDPSHQLRWRDRLRTIDATTIEVERALLFDVLAARDATLVGLRVKPVIDGMEMRGVRVRAVRPGSLAEALGLRA